MQEVLYDREEEEETFEPGSPKLQRVIPKLQSEPEVSALDLQQPAPAPSSTRRRRWRQDRDPGNVPLLEVLAPSLTEFHSFDPCASSSESDEMTGDEDVVEPTTRTRILPAEDLAIVKPEPGAHAVPRENVVNTEALSGIATQAHNHADNELVSQETPDVTKLNDVESSRLPARSHQRSGRITPTPLKLRPIQLDNQSVNMQDSSDAISPTLRKHVITTAMPTDNTLPALTSPNRDGVANSPELEKLPSIRQVTDQIAPHAPQLHELADVVTQNDHRYSHHHSPSYGSATAQSPALPYPTYTQASPGYGPMSATSPRSAASDQNHYGSPPQYPGLAYYAERRPSAPMDQHVNARPPPPLPSASSSGDSSGTTGSSIDGCSTSHTTPIDGPVDGTPSATAQSPNDGPPNAAILTGFKCEHQGCTASPFQTQYLLSSHKNVHSSSRPHYCPVKECLRSEGGKGFKRKNEMIRHGLVHKSPGYICPFCPDRDHRYPRPDNLQRHVRVHHVDKDKDDEALREVLAQRMDGNGKARRKRTNTMSSG